MKEFTFYEYEKIEMFGRMSYKIKADSKEEAQRVFVELVNSNEIDAYNMNDYKYLDDTVYVPYRIYKDENENEIDMEV